MPPESDNQRNNDNFATAEKDNMPKRGTSGAKSSLIKLISTSSVCSPRAPATVFPKSVSIGDLLMAGKLVKPQKAYTFNLEHFDVHKCLWVNASSIKLQVDDEKFASGAFRDAYKAKCLDPSELRGEWVLKRYQDTSIQTIETTLGMSVEGHTRKQVQMHAVARNITQQFATKAPAQFQDTFAYGKVFYSSLDGQPVTMEEYVPGEFVKYINNDGQCMEAPSEEYEVIFRKAESLVHFSNEYSSKKMMLLDIKGSKYDQLNDDLDDSGEVYFCAGNLSHLGISKFIDQHKCNQFCAMFNLGSETELKL